MFTRHALLGMLTLLLLAGCGGAPVAPNAAAPITPSSPAPTQAPAEPTVALVEPTRAPPTAAVPGIPTQAPTSAASAVVPQPSQAPTSAASAVVPQPSQAPTTAPAALATATPLPPAAAPIGEEILFLRGGALLAYAVAGGERTLASEVSDFAATPDGRLLALVRGVGRAAEIWLMNRDGSGMLQLTQNSRAERGLSWAPDGMSLAYSSAATDALRTRDWDGWSSWCAAAEARVLDLPAGPERTLGAGCDPAFAPDGRRIAFVTAPRTDTGFPGANNSVRIVNRQGANGWDFASATNSAAAPGYLVYAPAWSPDAVGLAYQRFMGYQALVDINLTELGDAFKGVGQPIGNGAGWLMAPLFAPDGRSVAVVEHNFSDARGFSGYDIWRTYILRLGESETMSMPSGEVTFQAVRALQLQRAVAAAWSPDGAALAMVMPAGWAEQAAPMEPLFAGSGPGTIWRLDAESETMAALAEGVDFASPLAWLPAAPTLITIEGGLRAAYPASWGLSEPSGPGEITAAGAGALIAARGFNLPISATPGEFFADLVPVDATLGEPITLPDGSIYRSFSGRAASGEEQAGAVRAVADANGTSVALIYRTSAARWPLERARAIALLAAGGV